MPNLFFSNMALVDLRDIRGFIAEDNPIASKEFIDSLVALCETLTEMPRMGRERPDISPGVCSIPHRGGNYMI